MSVKFKINLDEETHALAKKLARESGMTMADVIGAALFGWEKKPDEWKQQDRAVWDACRAFWKTMNETK